MTSVQNIHPKKYQYLKNMYKALKHYQNGGAAQPLINYVTSKPIRYMLNSDIISMEQKYISTGSSWTSLNTYESNINTASLNNILPKFTSWLHVFLILCTDSYNYISTDKRAYGNELLRLQNTVDRIIADPTFASVPENSIPLYLNSVEPFNQEKFKTVLMTNIESIFNATADVKERIFLSLVHVLLSRMKFNVVNPQRNVYNTNYVSTDLINSRLVDLRFLDPRLFYARLL
jgi:hypothetical protein